MLLYRTYIIGRADHFWGAEDIDCADDQAIQKGATDHGWSRCRGLGARPLYRAVVF
jgi:hypothetical protein